ncbi:VWA domain-containing protein [Aestuariibacter sp. GS-14]|uniref:vWA domain-containing protein n=1 Tax=Aestuariibacter sp. GS-14 TaxID=2590670 RepID=UPI00112BBB43|nr:VWA domain-containing protein [Aestuariibacter sp. GS-14]TPV54782.1 VWA domain-containing protein [Aestuariibacter sp. GS-14]
MKYTYLFSMMFMSLAFASNTPPANVPANVAANVPAAIIVDASNSMWGQVNGVAKIATAKTALQQLLHNWPANRPLSVWAYGHRSKSSCDDIEQIATPDNADPAALKRSILALSPKGRTPLTAAVEQAATSMQATGGTVILLTDGIESCDRDPCALAAELQAKGIAFTAHVVGFDITNERDKSQLSCLATSSGGRYFDAGNEQALLDALEQAQQPQEPAPAPQIVLSGAEQVVATHRFTLRWQGQAQIEDKVVLVPLGVAPSPGNVVAEAKTYGRSEAELLAPAQPGQYQAHYVFDSYNRRESIATHTLNVVPLTATLHWQSAPMAGSELTVQSDIQSDAELSLVLVEHGQNRLSASSRASFANGTGKLRLSNQSGEYDVILVSNWHANAEELIRQPLTIQPLQTQLNVASIQGQTLHIEWQGPGAEGDKIVLVAKGNQDSWGGALDGDFPAGTTLTLTAPAPGQYDVLYISDYYGNQTELARISVDLP